MNKSNAPVKASEALKRPAIALPKAHHAKAPIRASELMQRRQAETLAAIERAIAQREVLFGKLARQLQKIQKLMRQAKRYEKLDLTNGVNR